MGKNKTNLDPLGKQIMQMKSEGYAVFPADLVEMEAAQSAEFNDIMNFAALRANPPAKASAPGSQVPNIGGFTSCGTEIPVASEDVGTPGRGYIAWGGQNNLPNMVALATSMLTYTATALKFNVDVACGLGCVPMYSFYTEAGGALKEVSIPYAAAGTMLRSQKMKLYAKMFTLCRDYVTSPAKPLEVVGDSLTIVADGAEQEKQDGTRFDSDGLYFKRVADKALDEMIKSYQEEIAQLDKDIETWKQTNEELTAFLRRTSVNRLNQHYFTDLIHFGIFFPEIQLSQDGKTEFNYMWEPKIVSLGYRPAMACRLERKDDKGVSRYVYLCNKWINPQDSSMNEKIAALPAIDPLHPFSDFTKTLRTFRIKSKPEDKNIQIRPTRHILPISYPTSGRIYYPQPAYWAIFNDIYQFAANIIRDRSIRKANENSFGRIIYIHSEYLKSLTEQNNAAKTEDDKKKVRDNVIQKIKQFLSNKFNNGQALVANTFIGRDGKDHDSFRIETIPYNTKNNAEADKTEIADASGIIMFALECHPDLIGSTPGGASSRGGTYQREMLQIKQAKMAPTQQLVLDLYNFVGQINKWDNHLTWHITQRTLTTLDRNHSGQEDE